jgi:molecular chaperone DnaJ
MTKQQVVIPKGVIDGDTIRLSKQGNFEGDLLLKISVRKHREFIREGNNVKTEVSVPAIDAILGSKIKVKTIYGEEK